MVWRSGRSTGCPSSDRQETQRRPVKRSENGFAAAFPELSPREARLLENALLDAARRAGLIGDITSVGRSPLESTSYRTEVVTVDLDSGEHLKCFLKDFG